MVTSGKFALKMVTSGKFALKMVTSGKVKDGDKWKG